MRKMEEYRTTNNSSVYKKLCKYYLTMKGDINCSYCPYHKWENWKRKDHKSWKRYRKTQYREL